MTDQEVTDIVEQVVEVLGDNGRIEIDSNDAKISGFSGLLKRAKIRRPLCDAGIVVDFPSTGTTLIISRVGAIVTAAPTAKKKEVKKTTPVSKPAPKRHQHSYHKSAHVERIISIFNDLASHIVYLKGPTQCGKSTDAREVARLLGRKILTFSCNAETQYADIFGETDLKTDEVSGQQTTYWKEGIIEQACKQGLDEDGNEVGEPAVLFIDEAPSMSAEIAIGLNRFLESDNPRREFVIARDGGRTIWSHSGLRIIMAGNTALRGATTDNESFHTAQMASLDLSFVKRIFCCLTYGYNRSVEKSILLEKVGDDKTVHTLLKFRDEIRNQIRVGALATPFTTKDLIKIADSYRIWGDMGAAVYYTLFGFLLPEETAKYNELAMVLSGEDLLKKFHDDNMDYMN
jgi:hypothetical protein